MNKLAKAKFKYFDRMGFNASMGNGSHRSQYQTVFLLIMTKLKKTRSLLRR